MSLRIIEWLVTHYAKSNNIYYWIDNDKIIYKDFPEDNFKGNIRKINLYQDYRAQLKSYSKFNFDSFRRHHRITFFISEDKTEYIETTVGQLNFFRWIFNNNIINYAINNYDIIYKKIGDRLQKICKYGITCEKSIEIPKDAVQLASIRKNSSLSYIPALSKEDMFKISKLKLI